MKLYKIFDELNETNSLMRIFNKQYRYQFKITFSDEEIICENKTQFYIKMRDLGYMTETAIEIMNCDIRNYLANPIVLELGKTEIHVELIRREF